MQHLEGYLARVSSWMPTKDRNANLDELRVHLYQRLEKKQQELERKGERLSEAQFVKKLPYPWVAAHLYWPPNRWLHPLLTPVFVRFIKEPGRAYFVPMSAFWLTCWLVACLVNGMPDEQVLIHSLSPLLLPAAEFITVMSAANMVLAILPAKGILMPQGLQ